MTRTLFVHNCVHRWGQLDCLWLPSRERQCAADLWKHMRVTIHRTVHSWGHPFAQLGATLVGRQGVDRSFGVHGARTAESPTIAPVPRRGAASGATGIPGGTLGPDSSHSAGSPTRRSPCPPKNGMERGIFLSVEPRGLEPRTPCLQSRCATNCAMAPVWCRPKLDRVGRCCPGVAGRAVRSLPESPDDPSSREAEGENLCHLTSSLSGRTRT